MSAPARGEVRGQDAIDVDRVVGGPPSEVGVGKRARPAEAAAADAAAVAPEDEDDVLFDQSAAPILAQTVPRAGVELIRLVAEDRLDNDAVYQAALEAADRSVAKLAEQGIIVGNETIAFWKDKYLPIAISAAERRAAETAEEQEDGNRDAFLLQDPEQYLDFKFGLDSSNRSRQFKWVLVSADAGGGQAGGLVHQLQWHLGGGKVGVYDHKRINGQVAIQDMSNARRAVLETLRPVRDAPVRATGSTARGRMTREALQEAADAGQAPSAGRGAVVRYAGLDETGAPRAVPADYRSTGPRRGMVREFKGYMKARTFRNPMTGEVITVHPKRYTRDEFGNYKWVEKKTSPTFRTGTVRAIVRPVPLNENHVEWIWHKWMQNVLPDLPSAIPYWRSKTERLETTPGAIPLLTRGSINHLGMQVATDPPDAASGGRTAAWEETRQALRPVPLERALWNNRFEATGSDSLQARLPEAPLTALTGRTPVIGKPIASSYKGWKAGADLFEPAQSAPNGEPTLWAHGPVALKATDVSRKQPAYAWVFKRKKGPADDPVDDREYQAIADQAPLDDGPVVELTGNSVIVITKTNTKPKWMERLEGIWAAAKAEPARQAEIARLVKEMESDPPENYLRGAPVRAAGGPVNDEQALCLINAYCVSSEARDALMTRVDDEMLEQGKDIFRNSQAKRAERTVGGAAAGASAADAEPELLTIPEHALFCDPAPLLVVSSHRVDQHPTSGRPSDAERAQNAPKLVDVRIASPSADTTVRTRDPEQLMSGYSSVYRRTFFAPEPLRAYKQLPDGTPGLLKQVGEAACKARKDSVSSPFGRGQYPGQTEDDYKARGAAVDYEVRACLGLSVSRDFGGIGYNQAQPGASDKKVSAPRIPRDVEGEVKPYYPNVLISRETEVFDDHNEAVPLLQTYAQGFIDAEKIVEHLIAPKYPRMAPQKITGVKETLTTLREKGEMLRQLIKLTLGNAGQSTVEHSMTVWQLIGLERHDDFPEPPGDGLLLHLPSDASQEERGACLDRLRVARMLCNEIQEYKNTSKQWKAELLKHRRELEKLGLIEEIRNTNSYNNADDVAVRGRSAAELIGEMQQFIAQLDALFAGRLPGASMTDEQKAAVTLTLGKAERMDRYLVKVKVDEFRKRLADTDFGWVDPITLGDAARRFLFNERAAVSKYKLLQQPYSRNPGDVVRGSVIGGTDEELADGPRTDGGGVETRQRALDPAGGGLYLSVRYDTGKEANRGGVDTLHPVDGSETTYEMCDVKNARAVYEMLIEPTAPGRSGWAERGGAPQWFVNACAAMRGADLDLSAARPFPKHWNLRIGPRDMDEYRISRGLAEAAWLDPRYSWPRLPKLLPDNGPQSRGAPVHLHVRQLDAASVRGLWPFWAAAKLKPDGKDEWHYYACLAVYGSPQPLWGVDAASVTSTYSRFAAAGVAPAQLAYDYGAVDLRGNTGGQRGHKASSLFFTDTFRPKSGTPNNRLCLLWQPNSETEAFAYALTKGQPAGVATDWFPHRRDAEKPLMVIYPNRLDVSTRSNVYWNLANADVVPHSHKNSRDTVTAPLYVTVLDAADFANAMVRGDYEWVVHCGNFENHFRWCEKFVVEKHVGTLAHYDDANAWWEAHRPIFKQFERRQYSATSGQWEPYTSLQDMGMPHLEDALMRNVADTKVTADEVLFFETHKLKLAQEYEAGPNDVNRQFAEHANEVFQKALYNLKLQYDEMGNAFYIGQNPGYVGPLDGEEVRKEGNFAHFDAPPPAVLRRLHEMLLASYSFEDAKRLVKFATRPAERTRNHWIAERKAFTDAHSDEDEMRAIREKMSDFEKAYANGLAKDALLMSLRAMEESIKAISNQVRHASLSMSLMSAVFKDARHQAGALVRLENRQIYGVPLVFSRAEIRQSDGSSVLHPFHVLTNEPLQGLADFVDKLAQPVFALAEYTAALRTVASAVAELSDLVMQTTSRSTRAVLTNRIQMVSTDASTERRLRAACPRTMQALSASEMGPPWPTLNKLEELLESARAHLRVVWTFIKTLPVGEKNVIKDIAVVYLADGVPKWNAEYYGVQSQQREPRYATGTPPATAPDGTPGETLARIAREHYAPRVNEYWQTHIEDATDADPLRICYPDTYGYDRMPTAIAQALLDATMSAMLGQGTTPARDPWKPLIAPAAYPDASEENYAIAALSDFYARHLCEADRVVHFRKTYGEKTEQQLRLLLPTGLHAWAMPLGSDDAPRFKLDRENKNRPPADRWSYLYTRTHLFDRFERWVADGAPAPARRADRPDVESMPELRGKRVAQALQQLDALVGAVGYHNAGLAAAVWGALTGTPQVVHGQPEGQLYPATLDDDRLGFTDGERAALNGAAIRSNALRDLTARFVGLYEGRPMLDETVSERARRANPVGMPPAVLGPKQDREDFVEAVLAVEAERRSGQRTLINEIVESSGRAVYRLKKEAKRLAVGLANQPLDEAQTRVARTAVDKYQSAANQVKERVEQVYALVAGKRMKEAEEAARQLAKALKLFDGMDRRDSERRAAAVAKRMQRFEAAARDWVNIDKDNIIYNERLTAYNKVLAYMQQIFDQFETRRQQLAKDGQTYPSEAIDPFNPVGWLSQAMERVNAKDLIEELARNVAMLETPLLTADGLKKIIDDAEGTGLDPLETARSWVRRTIAYYQNEFRTMAHAEMTESRNKGGEMHAIAVGDPRLKNNNIHALRSEGVPRVGAEFNPEDERRRWEKDVQTLRNFHLKATIENKWKRKIALIDDDDDGASANDAVRAVARFRRLARGPAGTHARMLSNTQEEALRLANNAATAKATAVLAEENVEAEFAKLKDDWRNRADRRYELVQKIKKLRTTISYRYTNILRKTAPAGSPHVFAHSPANVKLPADVASVQDIAEKNVPKSSTHWYVTDSLLYTLLRRKIVPTALAVEGEVINPPLQASTGAEADGVLTEEEQEWMQMHEAEQDAKDGNPDRWVLIGVSTGRMETEEEAIDRIRELNTVAPAKVSDAEREWLYSAEKRAAEAVFQSDLSQIIFAEPDAGPTTVNQEIAEQRMANIDRGTAPGSIMDVFATDFVGPGTQDLDAVVQRGDGPLKPPPEPAKKATTTPKRACEPLCVAVERLEEALKGLEAALKGLDAALTAAQEARAAQARRERALDELLRDIFGQLLDLPPEDEAAALAALNEALRTPPTPSASAVAALDRAMGDDGDWRLPYARYLMGFVELDADGGIKRFVALPLSPLQWARAPGLGGGGGFGGSGGFGGAGARAVGRFAALRRAAAAADSGQLAELSRDAIADEYRPLAVGGATEGESAMASVAVTAERLLAQAAAAPPWRAGLVFQG